MDGMPRCCRALAVEALTKGEDKVSKRSNVLLAVAAAAALTLTACSSGGGGGSTSNQKAKQASATQNQINPLPYDQVSDGGTLRWAISDFPANFNLYEVDAGSESRS
jgi:peptide/nickel transport system substrate-binding protein